MVWLDKRRPRASAMPYLYDSRADARVCLHLTEATAKGKQAAMSTRYYIEAIEALPRLDDAALRTLVERAQ